MVQDENYNAAIGDLKFGNISLSIDTSIISFLEINDIEGKIRVKYRLHVEWRDSRLIYKNLKLDHLKNELNIEEKIMIWKPLLQILDSETHYRNQIYGELE